MGPIWGRQDPGGPHIGPMNFAIWVGSDGGLFFRENINNEIVCSTMYVGSYFDIPLGLYADKYKTNIWIVILLWFHV